MEVPNNSVVRVTVTAALFGACAITSNPVLSLAFGVLGTIQMHSSLFEVRSLLYHAGSLAGYEFKAYCKPNLDRWKGFIDILPIPKGLAEDAKAFLASDGWNVITDNLILGALPLTSEHSTKIAKLAGAVLSVVEELELKGIGFFGDPVTKEDWKKLNIPQKIISVPDSYAPTSEQIQEGIEFIDEHIDKGVFVHCMAGRGRSALMVICYLISKKIFQDFNSAYHFVKEKRPNVHLNACQREAVNNFFKAQLS